jgi:hypothetical protein
VFEEGAEIRHRQIVYEDVLVVMTNVLGVVEPMHELAFVYELDRGDILLISAPN